MRNLIVVLGDQLDSDSAAFDGFDVKQDAVSVNLIRFTAQCSPRSRE